MLKRYNVQYLQKWSECSTICTQMEKCSSMYTQMVSALLYMYENGNGFRYVCINNNSTQLCVHKW